MSRDSTIPLRDQLRALSGALRRLDATQGTLARKNARRRVALALSAVRRAMVVASRVTGLANG